MLNDHYKYVRNILNIFSIGFCFLFKILAGIYPIAQVQEPYTAVGYLAQWLPMTKLLKLEKLEQETPKYSALDICEGMLFYRNI
jgi:hypothetical protein